MQLAGTDDEILVLLALKHQPHRPDNIGSVTPIPVDIKKRWLADASDTSITEVALPASKLALVTKDREPTVFGCACPRATSTRIRSCQRDVMPSAAPSLLARWRISIGLGLLVSTLVFGTASPAADTASVGPSLGSKELVVATKSVVGGIPSQQTSTTARFTRLRGNPKLLNAARILGDLESGMPETAVIVTLHPTAAARALSTRSRATAQVPDAFRKPDAPDFYNLRDADIRAQLRASTSQRANEAIAELRGPRLRVTRQFSYQFGFAAEVDDATLEAIANHPLVARVERDEELEPHLQQGIPLMNAATPRLSYDGSGLSIAICDTGIDTSHPRLGGGGSPVFNSKVIGGYDTGDDDADPRPPAGGSAHGTACAGIAAGDLGTVGDYIGGVAPGARLYALKISPGSTTSSTSSKMIAAWEWAVTHQNDDPANPILIISTSFGGGSHTGNCDTTVPAMTIAAANAVAAGISIFASSGNDGYCSSMGWPACISYVNSVGAVYDANIGSQSWCVAATSCIPGKFAAGGCSSGWAATDATTAADKVTAYSNSASFLTLFAPSNNAYTTDIVGAGGYSGTDYATSFGGTSAATPYAAGAAAVLQSAAKALNGSFLSPAQVKQYLADSGNPVTDGKVAVTKPRVNLDNAVNALSSAATYTLTVASSGAAGIVIGSSSGHGGTTNYSIPGITSGTDAVLTAPPASGAAYFSGWAGCTLVSGSTCTVSMTGNKTVTATYVNTPYTLTVNSSGATGLAISSISGHAGTTDYSVPNIASGTNVFLEAPVGAGPAYFTDWTGCTSEFDTTCTVTMSSTKIVTAMYAVPQALSDGTPLGSLAGGTNSQQYFSIAVPLGGTNLQISTAGGTGDVDLHVRAGSNPTLDVFDCRPWLTGNNETCTFATPKPGTYFIMLHGFSAYSGVTLTASYDYVCPYPASLTVQATTISGTTADIACQTAIAGPDLTVNAGADVTFRAGQKVILRPVFRVQKGGVFRAVIDPSLSP